MFAVWHRYRTCVGTIHGLTGILRIGLIVWGIGIPLPHGGESCCWRTAPSLIRTVWRVCILIRASSTRGISTWLTIHIACLIRHVGTGCRLQQRQSSTDYCVTMKKNWWWIPSRGADLSGENIWHFVSSTGRKITIAKVLYKLIIRLMSGSTVTDKLVVAWGTWQAIKFTIPRPITHNILLPCIICDFKKLWY